jgi:multimeric flavodoxin WrbA
LQFLALWAAKLLFFSGCCLKTEVFKQRYSKLYGFSLLVYTAIMKIIGINGSPRKGWNTHILVEEALRGAASKGAETELVHLYDLRFRGCISCFECKRIGGKSLGRCAVKDQLYPVLEAIHNSGGLVLGAPVYIHELSAAARALIERLSFQYLSYRPDGSLFFTRRIPVLLIFTMNVGEKAIEDAWYKARFDDYKEFFTRILGPAELLLCLETLQANDYRKYEMTKFDEAARKKRRETVFPLDMKKAFELGQWTAGALKPD